MRWGIISLLVLSEVALSYGLHIVAANANNVFLQGSYLTAVVNKRGYFGSLAGDSEACPSGFYCPSENYVSIFYSGSQPFGSGTPPAGDMFNPGTPLERWTVGHTGAAKWDMYQGTIPVAPGDAVYTITDMSTTGTLSVKTRQVSVTACMDITQTFTFGDTTSYIYIDVSITNTCEEPLTDLRYMRNGDCDQDAGLGNYATRNTITTQNPPGPGASVSCGGPISGATLNIGTNDTRAIAYYGAFTPNLFGPLFDTVMPLGTTAVTDDAMSLQLRFGTLAPGGTVTFKLGYFVDSIPPPSPSASRSPSVSISASTSESASPTPVSITPSRSVTPSVAAACGMFIPWGSGYFGAVERGVGSDFDEAVWTIPSQSLTRIRISTVNGYGHTHGGLVTFSIILLPNMTTVWSHNQTIEDPFYFASLDISFPRQMNTTGIILTSFPQQHSSFHDWNGDSVDALYIEACESVTPTSSMSPSVSPSGSPTNTPSGSPSPSLVVAAVAAVEAASTTAGLSPGASAGIGVGVAIACLLLALLVLFCLLRKRRNRKRASEEDMAEDDARLAQWGVSASANSTSATSTTGYTAGTTTKSSATTSTATGSTTATTTATTSSSSGSNESTNPRRPPPPPPPPPRPVHHRVVHHPQPVVHHGTHHNTSHNTTLNTTHNTSHNTSYNATRSHGAAASSHASPAPKSAPAPAPTPAPAPAPAPAKTTATRSVPPVNNAEMSDAGPTIIPDMPASP